MHLDLDIEVYGPESRNNYNYNYNYKLVYASYGKLTALITYFAKVI